MDSKQVLTHLIRAGRDALHMETVLSSLGYKETPYLNLYGEIASAIYCMLDEDTDTFDESITHAVMHDSFTPDEISAEELAKLLDDASSAGLEIPDATRKIIVGSARNRGIETASMIRLILSEWAAKCLFVENVMQ